MQAGDAFLVGARECTERMSKKARSKSPAPASGRAKSPARKLVSPKVLGAVISLLLCVTTTQYFFAPPMKNASLRGKGAFESEGLAFWGHIDGEFDWCEPNYQYKLAGLPIAELVNTVSSLLYFIPPGYILCFAPHRDWWSFGGKLNFILVGCIAVGTTLFHASLRYWAQLVDELPIYYAMLNGCLCLYRIDQSILVKNTSEARFARENRLVFLWAAVLTTGLFITLLQGRAGFAHQFFRGIMSCSFSVFFAALFYGTARMLRKLETSYPSAASYLTDANNLFTISYVTIILAVICWISDNAFCAQLQNLPFGVPYPHTHSWWHVFTTWCLYAMGLTLELCWRLVAHGGTRRLGVNAQGFLPFVTA